MTKQSLTLESPKRYHPVAALLHWIIALLIFTELFLALAPEGPGGLIPKTLFGQPIVGIHMIVGTLVLVLLVIRFIMRLTMKRPERATAGHPILDVIGVLTHYALYLFTFAMALSGLVMSLQRGYFAQLWGIGSIPQTFNRGSYTWELIHGTSWSFLVGFIALHIGATLYHQFIRRDRLLGRMWVGRAN
ncbi:MAG: cytochrome b/b6 domain-containing protein [Anaerolineales bacterium]|jgi:cytochrome b561